MRHPRRTILLAAVLCGLTGAARPARIIWDRSTLVLVQAGGN